MNKKGSVSAFLHLCSCSLFYFRALVITTPAYAMSLILVAIEGIVVFGYFYTIGCDPKASKQISNPNQVI